MSGEVDHRDRLLKILVEAGHREEVDVAEEHERRRDLAQGHVAKVVHRVELLRERDAVACLNSG